MTESLYYNHIVQTIGQYELNGGYIMTAKEYLGQAKRAEARIGAMLERRQRYRGIAVKRGAGEADGLAGLEADIDRRIGEYVEVVRGIEATIDRVRSEECREVLRYRYLNGWSWQVIAERTHYSKDWLWRLHARGLEAVEEERTV